MNLSYSWFQFYKVNSRFLFSLILICLIPVGCSDPKEKSFSPFISLIDEIDTSSIQSNAPQLPKTFVQPISNDSLAWKLVEKGIQIAPIALPDKTSIKDQSIFLETDVEFKGFPSYPLDSEDIKNAVEKYTFPFEWVKKKGHWKFHPAFLLSRPQPEIRSFVYFKKHNGVPLFWTPKKVQLIQSNEEWSDNGKITVDIEFLNNETKRTEFNNDHSVKEISNPAGIYFGKRDSLAKGVEGMGILSNKHGDIIIARIKNSKLFSIFDVNMATPTNNKLDPLIYYKNFKGPRPSPYKISRFSIEIKNGVANIYRNNQLVKTQPISMVGSYNFGLINGIRGTTRFSKIKVKNYPEIKPITKATMSGFYFGSKLNQPEIIMYFHPNGVLSFGRIGKPPLESILIRKNFGMEYKLGVLFSQKYFSLFFNDELKIKVKHSEEFNTNKFPHFGILEVNGKFNKTKLFNYKNLRVSKTSVPYKTQSQWDPNDILILKKLVNNVEPESLKPVTITELKLDKTTRKAIITKTSSKITYKLTIPSNPWLSLSYAALPDPLEERKEVQFAVRVESEGRQDTVFSKALVRKKPFQWFSQTLNVRTPQTSQTRWHEAKIDLSAYAGQKVTLTLSTESETPTFGFWGDPVILSERKPEQPNLILISLDTLRADHLGTYGYPLPTSPNLDRLALEGTQFQNAIAQSPWTYPSHASFFTSQYPSVLGFDLKSKLTGKLLKLPRMFKPLPEYMRDQGYLTGAVTGGIYLSSNHGWTRGFSSYNEKWYEELEYAYRDAEAWLHRNKQFPFFLFFHTYEIHDYFEGKNDHYAPPYDASNELEHVMALYDGNIKFTDGFIGQLMSTVKSLGLEKNTLVIITSDHGESFEEHSKVGHGDTLYDELIRVPLIFRWPGKIPAGLKINPQVPLTDLLPTILEILDIKADSPMVGKSLLPFFKKRYEDRIAFSEGTARPLSMKNLFPTSIRTNTHKLIQYLEGAERTYYLKHHDEDTLWKDSMKNAQPVHELYDLAKDPQEKKNLVSSENTLSTTLSDQIKQFKRLNQKQLQSTGSQSEEVTQDNQTRKKFQALGYLQ